ncbi:hypothetical protein [Cellulomonas soli]|uniref:Uncharacterized protein n=1 Tax=Cellulomonas soli TaxID=931535 RepID=A0A512PC49_9CELL|nr:hypothetical protein [Cellulomonas soli]NYI58325.1 hypothetical protein [Cellulomonas soli]GEP68746.1 hypothetical protein CSO01_14610 [Cellulomonas soli]
MTDAPRRRGPHLSRLSLRVEVLDGRSDRPVVQILVDGKDLFATVRPAWRGFDPAEMLRETSPLVPVEHGQRVALYLCSCGIAGCGVIAPAVVASPDGRRVSWVDFRDYVGVFDGPLADRAARHEGRSWDLLDLHFDRDQYLTEVGRASAAWRADLRDGA